MGETDSKTTTIDGDKWNTQYYFWVKSENDEGICSSLQTSLVTCTIKKPISDVVYLSLLI